MIEIAVVNEPLVFEPLKFYCMSLTFLLGEALLYDHLPE